MANAESGGTGADRRSRIRQWLEAARDDFEREAPEVLEGMATDARKLAQFLDDKASKVRTRQTKDGGPEHAPLEQPREEPPASDEPRAS
jgi:hypothetical protein